MGLIEGLPKNSLVIYTSKQKGSAPFDAQLTEKFGAIIIRDRTKMLLPTPRINRKAASIMRQYQIKNVWFGAAAPLALMAKQLRKAGASNIVALSHGHELWWAKIPVLKQLLQKMIRDIDALGYLGDYTKSEIIKITSESKKLVQISPGIDINHFSPKDPNSKLIARYQLEGRRVIVCVARLVHRKGQDQLIKAMPDILKKYPDAILLIVGQGPIEQMLRTSARQLGITHKVVFTGRVAHSELTDYICLGEIFAMPVRSRFSGFEVEGLGIVYLEASACGLPVVVGNSGGAKDAVIDQVTGLLVDGTNVDQISNVICELLADPTRSKAMGEAGRGWVISNWQLATWSEKFNKLLLSN